MKRSGEYGSAGELAKRLARHPVYIASIIGCSVLYVAVSLYMPILTGQAVDLITGPGNVDFAGVARLLIAFVVSVAAGAVLQWILGVITSKAAYITVRDLRADAFGKLSELPVGYIDSHSRGDIVNRIMSDTEQIESGLVMSLSGLVTGVLTVASILVILAIRSISVAAVVLLVTPLSLFCAYFIAKKSYVSFGEQSKARGDLTGLMDEAVNYQRTVRANRAEAEFMRRFDEYNIRAEKTSMRAVFVSSVTNPSTRFINNLVFAGVALTGALSVISGKISVGALSCYLSYANQYTKPFNELTGIFSELQNAFACAGRVMELILEPPRTPEPEDAADMANVSGDVRFCSVDFSYTPDKPLLKGVDFHAAPGQKIAVVGPTGCGKTTLINLLMRFYDVTGGSITVDGVDVRNMTRRSLRGAVGMVLQETWIRRGTVRENIAMGKPDATDAEIMEAAKLSHAHSFIKRLPKGYDTVIGDDDGLSEGQRQLLCIARVMLRRPPMLILDEATSSIDTRTELVVQDAFLRLMEGRTGFIVAHRLSTVKDADLILVMRDGNIVESGTHDSLLSHGGFYAELYHSRLAGSAR